MDYAKLGLSCPLWPIEMDFGFIQKDLLLVCFVSRVFLHTSVSLSPVDKRNQTNNPRKRNSPLNTRVEEIRVEIPFEELVCYVLCVNSVYILFLY